MKSHKIYFYIAHLCLAFSAQAAPELIINGGFNNGTSGWIILNTNSALQQDVISIYNNPPLTGNVYKIRPGSQATNAGLSQTIAATPFRRYSWSVDIAAKELQACFPLGSFMLMLNDSVVVELSYSDCNTHVESLRGIFVPTTTQIVVKTIFNRSYHSFTASPEWRMDNVSISPRPFEIWDIRREAPESNELISIHWSSWTGKTYQVQERINLSSSDWQDIDTPLAGEEPNMLHMYDSAPDDLPRHFRVIEREE